MTTANTDGKAAEKANKSRRKIKNLWLNSHYQARYILWMLTMGMALTLANATLLSRYATQNYEYVLAFSPANDEIRATLQHELKRVVQNLILVSVGFTAFMGIVALFLSHRTAGPLYHFSRIFREITMGNRKARIRLRPTDDFRDVADDFNHMMDTIDPASKQG
jgi:methyl-accepting chemotaxis protein